MTFRISSKCPVSCFQYGTEGHPTLYILLLCEVDLFSATLLAFTALSAVQSSTKTHIQSVILVIDTSNNASYNQVYWLVGTPYSAIKKLVMINMQF